MNLIITSGLYSGFVSMLCRVLPGITDEEGKKALEDSLIKEFNATQGINRPSLANYGVVFYRSVTDQPMIPDSYVGPRIDINQEANLKLLGWRRRLEGQHLFPRYSRSKSMSRSTMRAYYDSLGIRDYHEIRQHTLVTSFDLQEYYHRTGVQIQGIIEMRQAWKYNDLKPRSYFAQGGKSYWASQYMQELLSGLCDIFPSTNRRLRFSVANFFDIPEEDLIILYDYTDFTSSMSEQKYFLHQLGLFLKGVNVQVFDLHYGFETRCLGEMVLEYNEVCNVLGEFSMERHLFGEVIFRHLVAGFLGVFGNITSCTFLHGIALSQIAIERLRCSCVGDDALFQLMYIGDWSRDFALSWIRNFGSVAEEKAEVFEGEPIEPSNTGWHYCKRPINRIYRRIEQQPLYDFPMINLVSTTSDSFHTVESRPFHSRQRVFIGQVRRLLDVVTSQARNISDEEELFIRKYLIQCYRMLELPLYGFIPGSDLRHLHLVKYPIPPIDQDLRIDPWRTSLLDRYMHRIVQIPVWKPEQGCYRVPCVGEFIMPMRKGWKMITDFGYCTSAIMVERVYLDGKFLRDYSLFLNNELEPQYSFEIVTPVPLIFHSLLLSQTGMYASVV